MRQLKIIRLQECANRRFKYKIFVDDKEVFEIADGQERFLTVNNSVTIQAKLMWCGSERVNIPINKEHIKELRVKANKGSNIQFPFFALIVLSLCSIINLVYPYNGLKDAMILIAIGVIIYALAMLTIWRNKFLNIELVRA